MGTRPAVLPLSIGDGELAETATVRRAAAGGFRPLPAARPRRRRLSRRRADRSLRQSQHHGHRRVRAPARCACPAPAARPEIATHAREVLIIMKQSPRSFVPRLDFLHLARLSRRLRASARRAAVPGAGPRAVITDFGILRPHPETEELQLTALYPGVTRGGRARGHRLAARRSRILSCCRRPRRASCRCCARCRRDRERPQRHRAHHPYPLPSKLQGLRHAFAPHPHAPARTQSAGAARARSPRELALLPARLSVRHGARTRRGSLGRRRQSLPRFREPASRVCSTGHAHPKVVQAIKDAADDFLHISSDYWHERMTRLAERINELNPMGEPVQVFVCQSGTEVGGRCAQTRALRHRPAALHRLPRRLSRPLDGLAELSPRASTRSRRGSSRPCRA